MQTMRIKVFSRNSFFRQAFVLTLTIFCFQTIGFSQIAKNETLAKSSSAKMPFLPLNEVKAGLKGKSMTVFRGTEPQEFNVEILGVLPGGIGPNQDLIIGRLSGGEADRTFVFAGMSGSPVYVDGKLIGAISYSFPFSKEPICGITPIEQMISIFEKNSQPPSAVEKPKAVSYSQLTAVEWKPNLPTNAFSASPVVVNPNLPSLYGQTFQKIATPVSFSGFSQETLNVFAPQLLSVGLLPVSAIGGESKMTPLKKFDERTLNGGASVSMQLTRGDYSLAASGTVTFRDGEKVYAFGHQFLGLGATSLPMSESSVITVIPNLNNSFKLAVPNAMVGSMSQDRNTGVFGKLGETPDMIPVKLNVTTSRNAGQVYNFEIAKDDFLTPLLMNISIFNAITATERNVGNLTVSLKGKIDIKGEESIKIERQFSSQQATQMTAGSVAVPLSLILNGGFKNAEINRIDLDITSFDGTKTATLERIALDRGEVKAGENFEVQAFLRTDSGQFIVQKIPMQIPADTPTGTLLVSLGDGASVQQVSASRQFVPKSLADLIKNINQIKKNHRLYLQLFRVTNGAIIGSSELPNLPPSMLATLNNDRTAGGVTPTVLTVLSEKEAEASEFIISGQQVLTIDVVN